MAIDRATLQLLKKFATAFREARERNANESDTVMYLVKFCEEVFGYDPLRGEISKEVAIRDRYCDMALKIEGDVRVLIEAKAASQKGLSPKHIEQAENYAARSGVHWVLLTNGIEWHLYHLSFAEGEGIEHDLAFHANLLEEVETAPDSLWEKLKLLTRRHVSKDALAEYWDRRKVLSPDSVVRVLFTADVLNVIRRELNREASARLEMDDVFRAVRDVLSKEALADAGDLGITKRRRRKRTPRTDAVELPPVEPTTPPTDSATPSA